MFQEKNKKIIYRIKLGIFVVMYQKKSLKNKTDYDYILTLVAT